MEAETGEATQEADNEREATLQANMTTRFHHHQDELDFIAQVTIEENRKVHLLRFIVHPVVVGE